MRVCFERSPQLNMSRLPITGLIKWHMMTAYRKLILLNTHRHTQYQEHTSLASAAWLLPNQPISAERERRGDGGLTEEDLNGHRTITEVKQWDPQNVLWLQWESWHGV